VAAAAAPALQQPQAPAAPKPNGLRILGNKKPPLLHLRVAPGGINAAGSHLSRQGFLLATASADGVLSMVETAHSKTGGPRRAYDIAVQFEPAPAQFATRSKLVSFQPRFMMINRLRSRSLLIMQQNVKEADRITELPPQACQGWYRADHAQPPVICVAFQGWRRSGQFPIDQVGEFSICFEQHKRTGMRTYFLRVKVTVLRRACLLCFRVVN